MAIKNQIQIRRGTADDWTNTNPVLASGEPGFETDTNLLKIGLGSQWDETRYLSASSLSTVVFNNTGSTIPKMSAVYITGGHGDKPTVGLALASGEASSSKTYGITATDILDQDTGSVIINGALVNVNTTQFNPNTNGTALWLSPTVSGGITTTKPYAPYHMVFVGTIVRSHAQEGVIEVKIQNGYELEELHNVATTGATNGQFLQYNSSSGLWLPSSSGNFTFLSVNNINVSTSGHTHASVDITNFGSTVSGLIPVKDIVAGANIIVSNNSGIFIISSSGDIGGGVNPVSRGAFLLTSSSGTFNVSGGYTVGSLDVFLNGVKLFASGDYTASNGTSFTLTTPAPSGSVIEYLSLVPGTNFSSDGVVVSSPGANRLLVNDGSTSGIIAQPNLLFNGSLLDVSGELRISGSGIFSQNVMISGVPNDTIETDLLLIKTDGTLVKRSSSFIGESFSDESVINALIFG